MKLKVQIIASILCAFSTLMAPATADARDVLLLNHKAWTVKLQRFSNGYVACTAETWNRNGDLFQLANFKEQGLAVNIYLDDRNYRGATIPVDMVIDVDYSRWTFLDTNITDKNFIFWFPNNSRTDRFAYEVMEGNAVALKTSNGGQTMASWSLAGSSAAIRKLSECVTQIL
ncbi:hypothetical protein [Loktanella salsilacus]|uniref:hypothetical protein n=1 Tax=Loktanella salsilacus TaxID=195913 RepID=UPI0037362D39